MIRRLPLVAAALGTLLLVPTSAIAGGRDDDDEEGEFEGDGPEAEAAAVFHLDDLIQVAVRRSPDLMRAKTDRDAARGQAGATRANQQWVMTMGAQYKSDAVGGQVKVAPFQPVQEDQITGSVGLGRNLPTGGQLQMELGLSHTTTEIDVPDALQPPDSMAGTSAAQTGGRIDQNYSRVQTQAKISLKQPLVRGFGPDIALAEENKADFIATAETLKAQLAAEEMIKDVVSGYWELAYANYEVETRTQALALAEAQEKLTREELRAGQTAQTQLNAVIYEIASRKDALLTAQITLEQKSLELRRKAGLGLGRREIVMRPVDAFEIGDDEWDVEEVLAQSRKANRKLGAIALQKKASDIEVNVAKNAMLPQVDVSLSGALLGGGETTSQSIGAIGSVEGYEVMAGLSVQFELSGAAKANHEAALARRRRLNVDRADTERQIDAAVVTAVKMVTSAKARVALADRAISVAEDNAKAEKLSFASGKSTNFNVMDRQTQLVDAQLRRGKAVADYHVAVAQLQFLSGTILEQYRVNVRPKAGR
jgi:outer membrane protein TolC